LLGVFHGIRYLLTTLQSYKKILRYANISGGKRERKKREIPCALSPPKLFPKKFLTRVKMPLFKNVKTAKDPMES
jgi:hypothetical protein